MDPLTYVSRLTKREDIHSSQDRKFTLEFVAIGIFIFIYLCVRLCESYIIPIIPEFIRTEIKAFFRWSPVIIPVIFGFTYLRSSKDSLRFEGMASETDDDVLKRRMWALFEK